MPGKGSPRIGSLTPIEMAERLRGFLAQQTELATDAVEVANLTRLAGGSSREIWSLDIALQEPAGTRRIEAVLRRDPPGRDDDSDRSQEFRLLRAAHRGGVPVPEPYWCCSDPAVLGTSFYLMRRVSGEALPRRLLRDAEYAKARTLMTGQLAGILAGIHALDPEDPELAGLMRPPGKKSPAEAELDRTTQLIREFAPEPHPVLELMERWLRERLPHRERRSVVHGDFRIGNVLFDRGGARSILDWELAKIGDPVEDLGWFCTRAWRFGNDDRPAGGIGSREELLAAYSKAGGEAVDPKDLRFWEALGSYKVALVFIQQCWVFRTGRVPSLELAALGRRTAEAEHELVRLMEERT